MLSMDRIHQAGLVHFHNALPSEKNHIIAMFKSMDVDKDGRISKCELLGLMNKAMPTSNILSLFAKLDRDRSGSLEFYEFVTFYYASISRPVCDGCKEFVTGLYYCCVRCWEMQMSDGHGLHQLFEVCAQCYSKKSFRHSHTEFLDKYVLFRSKKISALKREKTVKENMMDAALNAGRLYYQALSATEKNVACNLFREMDNRGDGRVSVDEVIGFITNKGMLWTDACKVFEGMGLAWDCSLSIEDVVALWYIFVMRPCCNRCKSMIKGMYYSCVACHDMSTNGTDTDACDLCPEC